MGRAGVGRRTALATATLVIGANLPDVDGFVYFFGTGTDALAFRRGWTHGVLAMAVWPFLLVAAMLGWDRLVRRRGSGAPVEPRALLLTAALAVWSHPLLDWLNTYGVRLLMPFSRRWFYGDALFIIDPWVWLGLGLAIVLGRGGRRARARAALLVVAGYAAAMAALGRIGRGMVEAQAGGPRADRVLVAPVFGTPFHREVVRQVGPDYEVGRLELGLRPGYEATGRFPAGLGQPPVAAAAATRPGRQFLSWARFPLARVEAAGERVRVTLSDVRYGTGPAGSWAVVGVEVPGDRAPR